MMNNKNLDQWNIVKKQICSKKTPSHFPKEGEVWIILLGINVGFEQGGDCKNFTRPVLVIKRFNNQMVWCVPLSTKQKRFDFYFNNKDPQGFPISFILAQLKLISPLRFQRKLYMLEKNTFISIKNSLKKFLS
jgi:mRNA-degrading endonuclease toxin of MazEF toxin-antitoxin module